MIYVSCAVPTRTSCVCSCQTDKKTCFLQTISSLRLPLTFLDLNNSRESHIIPQVETFLKSTTRDSASAWKQTTPDLILTLCCKKQLSDSFLHINIGNWNFWQQRWDWRTEEYESNHRHFSRCWRMAAGYVIMLYNMYLIKLFHPSTHNPLLNGAHGLWIWEDSFTNTVCCSLFSDESVHTIYKYSLQFLFPMWP